MIGVSTYNCWRDDGRTNRFLALYLECSSDDDFLIFAFGAFGFGFVLAVEV